MDSAGQVRGRCCIEGIAVGLELGVQACQLPRNVSAPLLAVERLVFELGDAGARLLHVGARLALARIVVRRGPALRWEGEGGVLGREFCQDLLEVIRRGCLFLEKACLLARARGHEGPVRRCCIQLLEQAGALGLGERGDLGAESLEVVLTARSRWPGRR